MPVCAYGKAQQRRAERRAGAAARSGFENRHSLGGAPLANQRVAEKFLRVDLARVRLQRAAECAGGIEQYRSMDNEEDRDISEENFLDDDHTLLSRIFGLGSH